MRFRTWWLVACLFVAVSLACTVVWPAEETPVRPWRCAENGGVNVLFCYLRAHGIRCDYAELLGRQAALGTASRNAAGLERIALEEGSPLRTVSLTMETLSSCEFPLIVHMDGATPEAGAFLLVVSMTPRIVYYVNGPSATIQSMDRESFRRVWSGCAFVPPSRRKRDFWLSVAGFGLGLALQLGFLFSRKGRA